MLHLNRSHGYDVKKTTVQRSYENNSRYCLFDCSHRDSWYSTMKLMTYGERMPCHGFVYSNGNPMNHFSSSVCLSVSDLSCPATRKLIYSEPEFSGSSWIRIRCTLNIPLLIRGKKNGNALKRVCVFRIIEFKRETYTWRNANSSK